MSKVFLTFIAVFLTQNALSAAQWHTAEIERVYPLAGDEVVIAFKTDSSHCSNGSSPKYHYITVGQNGVVAGALDRMFSTALAAATTGKQLIINFDDSTNKCYINRLLIRY